MVNLNGSSLKKKWQYSLHLKNDFGRGWFYSIRRFFDWPEIKVIPLLKKIEYINIRYNEWKIVIITFLNTYYCKK